MMPFDEINVGDMYQNPFHGLLGTVFLVEKKRDGLIFIRPHSFKTGKPVGSAFWKNSSDRMFSEAWRIAEGNDDAN